MVMYHIEFQVHCTGIGCILGYSLTFFEVLARHADSASTASFWYWARPCFPICVFALNSPAIGGAVQHTMQPMALGTLTDRL